jgi:hypothetical protein
MISHVKKGKKTHRGKGKENEKMEKSVCEGAACNKTIFSTVRKLNVYTERKN